MTAEQEARDLIEGCGIDPDVAQSMSAGDLVGLANVIAYRYDLEEALTEALKCIEAHSQEYHYVTPPELRAEWRKLLAKKL